MLEKRLHWFFIAIVSLGASLYGAPNEKDVTQNNPPPQGNYQQPVYQQASGQCCPAPAPAPCCPAPKPVQCCPPKPCCCVPACFTPFPPCKPPCQDICCPPVMMYNRNINPPAKCTWCNVGIFFTADFLWWRVDEIDQSLGFIQTVEPSLLVNTNGKIINFNYKWRPGFRVGIGYQAPYDGWDLHLYYTWFHGKANKNVTAPTSGTTSLLVGVGGVGSGRGIVSFWQDGLFSSSGFGSLTGNWRLQYNMFDLELGRDFFISCNLSLRPFIGAEGGWINRKWNTSFSNMNPGLLIPSVINPNLFSPSTAYSTKSNYWGVGPRLGLNSTWGLNWGFHVFGNFSAAILSGKVFKNFCTWTDAPFPTDPPFIESDSISNSNIFRIVPHLQCLVGFGWGRCFNCQKLYGSLRVGWETNHFWNLPQAIYPDMDMAAGEIGMANRENRAHHLGLAGLTVDARFEF